MPQNLEGIWCFKLFLLRILTIKVTIIFKRLNLFLIFPWKYDNQPAYNYLLITFHIWIWFLTFLNNYRKCLQTLRFKKASWILFYYSNLTFFFKPKTKFQIFPMSHIKPRNSSFWENEHFMIPNLTILIMERIELIKTMSEDHLTNRRTSCRRKQSPDLFSNIHLGKKLHHTGILIDIYGLWKPCILWV